MNKPSRLRTWSLNAVRKSHNAVSTPAAIAFLTYSKKVDPSYGMTWRKRMGLGWKFRRNFNRVQTGTSWRAHLVMAMKLLEISPNTPGDVVECGCWKGGATVNLSLIAKITGRKLKVYDSFEGLPAPVAGDPVAERSFRNGFVPGVFGGSLEEVTENVRKYGALEVCEFTEGWFDATLPDHQGDIVLAFWDVDFYSSLHDCLINLWPSVIEGGFVFMDEYREVPYCAVFYSEKYWEKYFSQAPPGLVGIGTGVQVGMFYTDPSIGMGVRKIQSADSIAYSVKGTRALWEFYPDENPAALEPEPKADVPTSGAPTG